MSTEAGDEDIVAIIIAAIVTLPILVGAFAVVHFGVEWTHREWIGAVGMVVVWVVFWNQPHVDQPRGDVSWMLWLLGLGGAVAFATALYASAVLDDITLFWDWAVVSVACLVSFQQAGFRHDWGFHHAE